MNTPDKATLLAMLRKWIAQRPGLEFGNYGDVSAYRSEMRSITKDRHVAEEMIRFCEWHDSITAENIMAGFRSFSGRLTLTQRADGKWVLDYCTGQYWPTEYRRAVCAVLSSVILDYYRSDMVPDSFGVQCLGDDSQGGYVPATSKRWKTRAEAEAYAATVAEARYPMLVEFHKGERPGDYLRRTCARQFGRTVARRFFN